MKIAALVSGGVDSSVVVPLLKEQGYDPHIFYIKIGMEGKEDLSSCPSEEDIEITTYIAKKYGCTTTDIKNWNGLKSNTVKIGQKLTIKSGKSSGTPKSTKSKGKSTKKKK